MSIRHGWLLMFVAALSCSGCAYASIGSGEVGVVRTPEGMSPQLLQTGDWKIGGDDKVTVYNTRSQEQAERLEVLAANGLKIVLDASIRYHVIPNEALALDRELGPQYYQTLIGPTLKSQARRVVGRYQPEEIYAKERETIEKQIREGVEQAVRGRHIALEAVLIRNVQLPDSIQAAINNKLEAEQSALKMKFVLDQSKQETEKAILEQKGEAERMKIEAQARADAEKIEAQSQADAKRLEGQAIADYQQALDKTLDDKLLRYYQIQSMKGLADSNGQKVIYFGDGAKAPPTMLDMRQSVGTSPK